MKAWFQFHKAAYTCKFYFFNFNFSTEITVDYNSVVKKSNSTDRK